MEKRLKKFQFVLIDEKNTWIKYDGVEQKGPRPFLVVRSDLYGKYFIACPMTDKDSVLLWPKVAKKSYLKIEYLGKESFIKMNMTMLFPKEFIEQGIIIPIDRHLNKSQRNIAIKLLKDSFDD